MTSRNPEGNYKKNQDHFCANPNNDREYIPKMGFKTFEIHSENILFVCDEAYYSTPAWKKIIRKPSADERTPNLIICGLFLKFTLSPVCARIRHILARDH